MSGGFRRDRRGRGVRGPVIPQDIPRWMSRSQAFDQAVVAAYAPLARRFSEQLRDVDIAVDVVPRMSLSSDAVYFSEEIIADGPVPLARLIPPAVTAAGHPTRARIVIFRQPVQARVTDTAQRQEVLRHILAHLVAVHLNLDVRDVDPAVASDPGFG